MSAFRKLGTIQQTKAVLLIFLSLRFFFEVRNWETNTNTHNYIPAGLGRTWVGGEKILAATARNKGFPGGSEGKVPACNMGDLGSIPGLGKSPGGRHGNPLLAWRIPMDRGPWQATVHGVTKSWTPLSN